MYYLIEGTVFLLLPQNLLDFSVIYSVMRYSKTYKVRSSGTRLQWLAGEHRVDVNSQGNDKN